MKREIILTALTISAVIAVSPLSSYADQHRGFYIGGALGYSEIDTPDSNVFVATPRTSGNTTSESCCDNEIGGIGGSIFAGYDFNPNIGIEIDYVKYADSEYKTTQSEYTPSSVKVGENTAKLSYSTHSYDIYLKGMLPLDNGFLLFAKIGIGYISQDQDYSNQSGTPTISTNTSEIATPSGNGSTESAFRPAGGVGIGYRINDTFMASVFAQGVLGRGDFDSDSDAIASAYLIGAGITVSLS